MKNRACELELYGRDDVCTDHDLELREIFGSLDHDADCESPCCFGGFEPAEPDDRYTGPLERVLSRAADEESRATGEAAEAEALYDELMRLSRERREVALHTESRFASFALADRLLDACREVRHEQPEASLELAHLALAVAGRLDAGRYGSGISSDLTARAWAYLGDLWIESSPPAAGEAFRLALGHLLRGSGDPLEEAEVVALCAGATDDPSTTVERLDRAGTIYRSTGDALRLGEVMARKARASGQAGDHLEAVGLLREAAALLCAAAPPITLAELAAETAHHLVSADRPEEAWDELARARSVAAGGSGRSRRTAGTDPASAVPPALRLRLCWIEGRVAAALGLEEEARKRLEEAREGFLATGRRREAVRAHLDLAELSARIDGEGYDRAMDQLARETPRVLAGADLPRESTTVLLLVEQAARRRALRPDLVRAVTGLLENVA
jgi:hypothetical protein